MMHWFLAIFLFGVVVFIHELGHFLVAKLANIRVERFSIGFGPILLRKKWGETEYAISALPLGGYVKMFGEDPSETSEAAAHDPRSFSAKSPLTRIAVASMGPVANLILPLIIFSATLMVVPTFTSRIGSVVPNSPADKSGIEPGDRVVAVNGEGVWKWEELYQAIRRHPHEPLDLQIERNGKPQQLTLVPEPETTETPLGEEEVGRAGISPYRERPVIGISNPSSPAAKIGLQTGDIILSVDDHRPEYWKKNLWAHVEELFLESSGPQTLTIKRIEGEFIDSLPLEDHSFRELSVTFSTRMESLSAAGIDPGEFFLRAVRPGSIAHEKGLRLGDKLVSINGKHLESWEEFQKAVLQSGGEAIRIGIVRAGKTMELEILPREESRKDELTHETITRRQLGVISAAVIEAPEATRDPYLRNPFYALADGIQKTIEQSLLVAGALGKVVTGQIELKKSLGGPISIFYLAGDSYKKGGWLLFFQMMAMLSITLGVLNILPIPVLDGGHILFYLIELAKGSPVSLRAREIAQQVGFVLLIGLLLVTFYLDIERYFDRIKSIFTG